MRFVILLDSLLYQNTPGTSCLVHKIHDENRIRQKTGRIGKARWPRSPIPLRLRGGRKIAAAVNWMPSRLKRVVMSNKRNDSPRGHGPDVIGWREVLSTGGALLAAPLLVGAKGGAQPPQPEGQQMQTITINRSGSQPSSQGPDEYFTGSVRIDPLFSVAEPSRISGARVTFEPGARTAWHAHPLGQTLIGSAGTGWVQQWGGPVEEMREGDVVRIPPGVKHWHGATPTTRMTHIALQEQLDGKVVDWMEKVSDEQYRRP
jgi:quercetin dioxygenase-like cupin family protein